MLLNDRIESNSVAVEGAKCLSVLKILSFKQPWGILLCRFFIEPIWWFNGVVPFVGMGSKLMAKDADGNFDYAKKESNTKGALDIIKSHRK